MNIFNKFRTGLNKSSNFFKSNIINSLKSNKITSEDIENIESILISGDVGIDATNELINKLQKTKINSSIKTEELLEFIAIEITNILKDREKPFLKIENYFPNVLIFVGVNGSGKTTTIGKIISKLHKGKILLAACDTFRAAAVDQLKEWAEKKDVDFFQGLSKQDPASVAYQACEKCKKEKYDYLLIDTAGRLSNNANLINQLNKINSVVNKSINNAKPNNILVLDGTNGANMMTQVEIFSKAINVSGLIITKLDGTAKGGAIISIAKKFQIPIYFIGLGEKDDDLHEFDAEKYAFSMLGLDIVK